MRHLMPAGLTVRVPSAPPESLFPERLVTEEAAIHAFSIHDFRITPLVAEGDEVAQGQPVLRDRRHPEVVLVAPMPARVAALDLGPGRRLSAMEFFHEPGVGRHVHDIPDAAKTGDPAALRRLLLGAGVWHAFGSRPFARVPGPAETPAAIFVMAADTRPLAPDPMEDADPAALDRGIDALLRLSQGPVFLVLPDAPSFDPRPRDRLRVVHVPPAHPHGLPGFAIHRHFPAAIDRPVWDIHAEDTAAIGHLLDSGLVPDTRLVRVAGPALTTTRLVRCQPGADLRGLCYGHERPGRHRILSGSALDGHAARWLGTRDRQVTALSAAPEAGRGHWFLSALQRASRPLPLIPTAALDQSMGGAMPAAPFLRALAAGDAETFKRLGGLCLAEQDMALADYAANADPPFAGMIRTLLNRIQTEEAG